jgi:hypothetical protein
MMEAKTLEALKASIAKWEKNAVAKTAKEYRIGWENCPLCLLFIDDHCAGCPIEKVGSKGCLGTPYDEAEEIHEMWLKKSGSIALAKSATAIAIDEVAFLKSLLPSEAS